MTLSQWMNFVTKLTYIVILIVLSVVPVFVWARNPEIDLSNLGPFIAGLGVPMGTLTAAMAARGIGRDRAKNEHRHQPME